MVCHSTRVYLTERVHKVILQKSILVRIRQLILHYYSYKGSVDGFVQELTLAKQLCQHLLWDKSGAQLRRREISPVQLITYSVQVQGYLAHEQSRPPRTRQQDYA